jgi:putative transcriptional regulator
MTKSILEVVHETAKGLHKAGLMGMQTMHEFDALCLPPVKKYSPQQIKRIRLRNKASQAVFAALLLLLSKNGSKGKKNRTVLH